jgi:hypothetical protein
MNFVTRISSRQSTASICWPPIQARPDDPVVF